ncbi:hypothetical protein [uncultured Maribacter sp.]|uniref:hypothetical protein n=1 Tax=uncultured Maribacter sp. TaxID=431308 RepID=UPI00261282B0|nr:hypothetical protein [uncultured Maribacter sp.]
MKLKHKALLCNFVCFAVIFVIARLLLGYFVPLQRLVLAVIAAVIANVLSPKFAVAKINGKEKMVMKWILKKGIKEF